MNFNILTEKNPLPMRRRGEAVSPMLLKLISENHENPIEFAILAMIGKLDTVRIESFLEYARKRLREGNKTMSDFSAAVASDALAQHGTKEDEALLEKIARERPLLDPIINEHLKVLRERLYPKPVSTPQNQALSRAKPWLFGGLILVVLLGIYRLHQRLRRKSWQTLT